MKPKIRARPVVRAKLSTSLAGSLSSLSSLITASILSFFVDALHRAYISIPWPRDGNIEEDEKSIMMKDINLEGKRNNMLELSPSNASSSPQQHNVPSPERDQGIASNAGDYPIKFANQNTQYDAGNNMI